MGKDNKTENSIESHVMTMVRYRAKFTLEDQLFVNPTT